MVNLVCSICEVLGVFGCDPYRYAERERVSPKVREERE